jgi:SAM-dependent methyltransferase
MLKKIINTTRNYGVRWAFTRAYRSLFPSQYEKNELITGFDKLKDLFAGKTGIEIGGPSAIFTQHIPLYNIAARIDGCNFSNSTVWEGKISEGLNFKYGNKVGYQFLAEATKIAAVENGKYDFVISSNCLEHVANPMQAVQEWLRLIKSKGSIVVIVPNKNYCFDHRRPYTTFQHITTDFKNQTSETDLTHLPEVLKLHDLSLDPGAGTRQQFDERSHKNFEYRCLHHHVFSKNLLIDIFKHFNVEVRFTHTAQNHVIIGVRN